MAKHVFSGNVKAASVSPVEKLFYDSPVVHQPISSLLVDWNLGGYQIVDLSLAEEDVALTFDNPEVGKRYSIAFQQGEVARQVIFPHNVLWPEGQPISLDAPSGGFDLVAVLFDGGSYLVNSVGLFFEPPP